MSSMEKFIRACLVDASAAILKAKKAGLTVKAKARNDMATSADMAAEKLIVSRIRGHYPDSAVLSEESYQQSDLEADSLFIIDPIDGTHNFIQGIPLYGVSVAHFSGGKPTAGGTYFVQQGTVLYAEKGKQATANGKRISVSSIARLKDAFLLCDSRLHTISDLGYGKSIIGIERISQHTRFLGAAVYDMGYVAMGMAEASIHFKLKPYDFAASAFIAEQAGGKVTDFEGRAWSLSTKRFVTSNSAVHKQLLGLLKSTKQASG